MSDTLHIIRIFLGSPSDTTKERDIAERFIRKMNENAQDFFYQVHRWEDLWGTSHIDAQDHIINEALMPCDIVLSFFKHKFGKEDENKLAPTQREIEIAGKLGKKILLIQIEENLSKDASEDEDAIIETLQERKKVKKYLKDNKDWIFYKTAKTPEELEKHILVGIKKNAEIIVQERIEPSDQLDKEILSPLKDNKNFLTSHKQARILLGKHDYYCEIAKILETSLEFRLLNFTQDEWIGYCESPETNVLVSLSMNALQKRQRSSSLNVFRNAYRLSIIPISKAKELLPIAAEIHKKHKSLPSVRNEVFLTENDSLPSFKYTFSDNHPESEYFIRRAIFYHNKSGREQCLYSITDAAASTPEYLYSLIDEGTELFQEISKACGAFLALNKNNGDRLPPSLPIVMTVKDFLDTIQNSEFPHDRRKRAFIC